MNYEQDQRFDDYLKDGLSTKERANFERDLEQDQALNEAFTLHKSALDWVEIAEIKSSLNSIHEKLYGEKIALKPEHQKIQIRNWYTSPYKLAIAAILMIAMGLATWRYLMPDTNDRLYAKYYAPDAGLPGMMGSSNTYNFDDAMVDYKSEEYASAIQKFSALLKQRIGGDSSRFYLALSQLGKGNYQEAETNLSALPPSSSFSKKAIWYKALAHLKLDEKEQAILLLRSIAADGKNEKASAAAALLKELKP